MVWECFGLSSVGITQLADSVAGVGDYDADAKAVLHFVRRVILHLGTFDKLPPCATSGIYLSGDDAQQLLDRVEEDNTLTMDLTQLYSWVSQAEEVHAEHSEDGVGSRDGPPVTDTVVVPSTHSNSETICSTPETICGPFHKPEGPIIVSSEGSLVFKPWELEFVTRMMVLESLNRHPWFGLN